MNCPLCGINHRSENKAQCCYMQVENRWAHYIILCINMKGGVTEENLKQYTNPKQNIPYYRETKKLRERMAEYMREKGFYTR